MHRRLHHLPAYIAVIIANALPVYGAVTGRLLFFQVLYLYWVECVLLIFFDAIRVACARGKHIPEADRIKMNNIPFVYDADRDLRPGPKLRIVRDTVLVRGLLMGVYLLFIVFMIGDEMTAENRRPTLTPTLLLRDAFMQTALAAFLASNVVQLIGGYFFSGQYRRYSPRVYQNFLSLRVIIMHVMIVGSVFIHQIFFRDRSFAGVGEVVYVGLFMLLKTVLDIRSMAKQRSAEPDVSAPMI